MRIKMHSDLNADKFAKKWQAIDQHGWHRQKASTPGG